MAGEQTESEQRLLGAMAYRLKGGAKFQEEPFELRTGQLSNWYFDAKRALSSGLDEAIVGRLLVARAHRTSGEFTNICGMGIGGYAVMFGMVFEAREVEWTMVAEGDPDDPDTGLTGGNVAGKKVLVVDDVLTSGSSLCTTIGMVREGDGIVENALTMVTRSDGEAEQAVYDTTGVKADSLFVFSETSGMLVPKPEPVLLP